MLTLNSFEADGDGSELSECDNQYHSDVDRVVVLYIGWFNYGKRQLKCINSHSNEKSVKAKVVDECDSNHEYKLPCSNNIVDFSKAVWKVLGDSESDWGEMYIYWSNTDYFFNYIFLNKFLTTFLNVGLY